MGKILEVFQKNRKVIIEYLSQNLRTILHLLQKKGVYQEEKTHDLLKDGDYGAAYDIVYHVDANGYYAEFVAALTEAGASRVAELVRRKFRYS